jgi:hypothetical protein
MLGIALFLIVGGYVVIYAGVKSLGGTPCSLKDALTTCCGKNIAPVNERSKVRGTSAGVPRTVPIVAPVPVGQPIARGEPQARVAPYFVPQGGLSIVGRTQNQTTNALNRLADWLREQLRKARGRIPGFPLPPPPLPGF